MKKNTEKRPSSLSEKIKVNRENLENLYRKRDNLNDMINNLEHRIINQEKALSSQRSKDK